ncbi:MAG: hypothetical protein V8Q75_03040 [Bacilli bacterium]
MNNIYLVSYINLFDKIYAITIDDQKQINFLESRIIDDKRTYSQPALDQNITNLNREQIVNINKNLLIQSFTDHLNNKMKQGLYQDKNELLNDINQFKKYINNDPKLKDFLYFQDALEQIKFDNNIKHMLAYFDQAFKKPQTTTDTLKQNIEESLQANDIVEATLDNGTKIAVDMNKAKENSQAEVIALRPDENLTDVLASQATSSYSGAAEILQSMADHTHISTLANKPPLVTEKEDVSLAKQVALNQNQYHNKETIATGYDSDLTSDGIIINTETNEISELSTMNDGSIYLNGTTQNNISNNGIESYQTHDTVINSQPTFDIEKQEVLDDPQAMQEFDELESLYNSGEKEEWTNKVEYLYETNRDKWEEYMAYHDTKQNELKQNKAPQKSLGSDPRAAFIDISIIALITSIIGTSTLLAILINLM